MITVADRHARQLATRGALTVARLSWFAGGKIAVWLSRPGRPAISHGRRPVSWSARTLQRSVAMKSASLPRPVEIEMDALGIELQRLRAAARRLLLLDYDGTLVPIARSLSWRRPIRGCWRC